MRDKTTIKEYRRAALERVPLALYVQARDWLLAHDPDGPHTYQWARAETGRPATSDDLAGDVIWIILCAGRSAQAARTIEAKVWDAIHTGRPVVEVFGYRKKADAIERAWRERGGDFEALTAIPEDDIDGLITWCESIPFVGDDTKFQLAKNFGADVCKPDIWLCRLAGFPDRPRRRVEVRFKVCQTLCEHLGIGAGDSIATVDTMLWLACNKGVITVSSEAGPVTFTPPAKLTARAISPQAIADEEEAGRAQHELFE
jgi:hypothetical protein